MNPIELIIPQNGIKERKLLKELYLTLLNIEQKHRQESKRISEKLINLENAVRPNVNQSQHNRFSIKAIFEEDFDVKANFYKEGGLIVGTSNRIRITNNFNKLRNNIYETMDLNITSLDSSKLWKSVK